jgi:diaminopimelate decarboxylase
LYNAWQNIIPVSPRDDGIDAFFDVVGPVCETGDFLGKNRHLNLLAHDLIAIRGAGAYGFSMSSNYNTRPRAAEVMVDGSQHYRVRDRETISSLFQNEHVLPEIGK